MLRRLHFSALFLYVIFAVYAVAKGIEIRLLRVERLLNQSPDDLPVNHLPLTLQMAQLSLAFFALVLLLFSASVYAEKGTRRWTALGAVLTTAIMLLWSLLMWERPGHISFDEVYPAWLAAAVLLFVFSVLQIRSKKRRNDPDVLDQDFLGGL